MTAPTTDPYAPPDPVDEPAHEVDEEGLPLSVGDRVRKLLESGESSPLYPRLLRLRHVQPNGWQRAALVEGMVALGALAALADRATSWAPLILPVAAAAVVKFHDVLAGVLPARPRRPGAEADPDDATADREAGDSETAAPPW